ncbi:MAG: shikimate kinase [Candidatus Sumerlaeia bacterium]|nr:shikimate kinase [Candidatus Sumerlaeia bacterium]
MSQRCVVLTGMMGAGKTEVGELLAENLGYTFIDTDHLIEKRAKKKITQIFEEHGEEFFRDMESEVIQSLVGTKNAVVSVGGGACIREVNRLVFKGLGHVVYLKASARELYYRLKNDTTRPLLRVENPQEAFKTLLAEREKFYTDAANITIDTEHLSIDEVTDELIDHLARLTVETQFE